ncbi:feruloyl CoA ortho-hydroxylase F6H1-3-like [Humulus lupulus]|uniref:feruloyl CoA ortho-hydroxylase F6H1-3-like n=1 Tax=Humulus lupulus TaxID=3486 RepID=UPI002B40D23D|nr:feruloyl CoA ortho-hydroxylase F6H1-3-like [Humulus lupulus]
MAPTLAITSTTEPSKVTEFVIHKGFGVKGLSESGLRTLPKQYIQPLEERVFTTVSNNGHDQATMAGKSIPIIDMSNWEDPKTANSICEAAEKWGFFQIVNHGIPLEVIEGVEKATHRFFELPAEEKNRFSKENSSSNSVRYGTSFTPMAEKALEWKDYLSLFYVSDDEASQLWPSPCKDDLLEYMKKTETVIKRLLEVLMKRLNVTKLDKAKESMLMGSKRINLNFYPICPNPDLTVGVGRHSDVSTLTILLQDEIGGLYVRVEEEEEEEEENNNNKWVHVPPMKGSLVINIGDALQIMSNGRYKSVEHRVVANGNNDRISVPIFVNPKPSDLISPFPQVLANGEKALYKQVLYSDYVKHFFRKAHDGKQTVDFAKI